MVDIFDSVLKSLDGDQRSLAELERLSGVPSETIRDIKARKVSPRIDTIRKIAALYRSAAAA